MTNTKRLLVLSLVLAMSAQVLSAERQRFIPWSPLNQSEASIQNAGLNRTYRDADIFKVYPELSGLERLSACSNRMMQDATEFVFLASKRKNEVTLKTFRCSRASKGLNCGAVKEETRYFRDGSDRYFSLEGVTLAKADELLDIYESGRVTGLPDWMSTEQKNISLIKAMPDDLYLLIFGDYLCAGCVFKINVRIVESDAEKRLVVVGQPEGDCF